MLAILFFLAVNSLWDRLKRLRRIEGLVEQSLSLLERPSADKFFQRNVRPTNEFFSNASLVDLAGITLGKTTLEFTNILRQRLIAGANIRIILIDTSSEVLNQTVIRSWSSTTPEYYKKRIDTTSSLIEIVGSTPRATGSLQIGYLPYVPSFGIIMTDADSPKGAAFIEIYHHNSNDPSPAFEVTANKDPYWFHFYKEQFELMWKNCSVRKILEGGKTSLEIPKDS